MSNVILTTGAKNLIRSTRSGPKWRTPEYKAWTAMQRRCYAPEDVSYVNYGARGIRVCDKWRLSFETFLADVGPRPVGTNGKRGRYTLDRINNDGNYEPGNVRWATWEEQQSNRRSSRRIAFNGMELTIAEWARRIGISRQAVRYRLEQGWPIEDVIMRAPCCGLSVRDKVR